MPCKISIPEYSDPNIAVWLPVSGLWWPCWCIPTGILLKVYLSCTSLIQLYNKFYITYRTHCKISRSMCSLCEFNGVCEQYTVISIYYRSEWVDCYGSAGPSMDLCISEVKSTVGITPGLVSGVESRGSGVWVAEVWVSRVSRVGSVMEAKSGRLLTKSSLGLDWYYWFGLYTSESICLVSRSSVSEAVSVSVIFSQRSSKRISHLQSAKQ